MNELQKLDRRVSRELAQLYEDLKSSLVDADTVEEAMQNVDYYMSTRNSMGGAVGDAAVSATIGTPFLVERTEITDYFLFTNHAGGKLSDTLRSGEAANAIKSVLKDSLRYERSVYEVADKISKDQLGALPKSFNEMLDNARRSGQSKSTINSIRRAEKHLANMGEGTTKASVQLRNSYKKILADVKSGKSFDDSVAYAVDRKVRAINERIARTEIARASAMTSQRAYEEDPNTHAYRYILSPEHPVFDECDIYAEADSFGIGAGVYPVGQGPVEPVHPHCMCTTEPVKGEQGKGGRYSEKRVKDYVAKQPAKNQRKLLGKDGKIGDVPKVLKKEGFDPKGNNKEMIPKSLLKTKEAEDE